MILYLVRDRVLKTLSLPQLADSFTVVENALKEMNPENLADLEIVQLEELDSIEELLLLRCDFDNHYDTFADDKTPDSESTEIYLGE